MIGFGVDIGGTGTKGAPVDLATGELLAERLRIPTPQPATPEALADVTAEIVDHFGEAAATDSPIGVAIPAVVHRGVARSAANIDESWIDRDVDALFTEVLGREVHVLNDADAAGIAEARFGAAKDASGTVVLLTLGTGIGSAVLHDGALVPNTEFGHLLVDVDGSPRVAETWAATSIKEAEDLSWEAWAERLQVYVDLVERLVSPEMFVIGGGVSKSAENFVPLLSTRAPITVAVHRNNAGIIGAAAIGADHS